MPRSTPTRAASIQLTVRGAHGDGRRSRSATTGSASRPNILSTVFDMFTQVDPIEPAAQGGLGIGLTLGAQPGRDCTAAASRRDSDGLGTRQRVHRPAAPGGRARQRRRRRPGAACRPWSPRSACSSWTTTRTPPTRSATLLAALGATVQTVHDGRGRRWQAVDDVPTRRGAARHRDAGDGRLRGGAAHPRQQRRRTSCSSR